MDMRKNINAAQAGDADPFWWKEKSKQKNVLNDSYVCSQDLSEYVGLSNIKWGFHG